MPDPIVWTSEISTGSDTDASSYSVASDTYLANTGYLMAVCVEQNFTSAVKPTIAGWEEAHDSGVFTNGTQYVRTTVFFKFFTVETTSAYTIDFGGVSQAAVAWHVERMAVSESTLAAAIVQAKAGGSSVDQSTLTISLDSAGANAANSVVAFYCTSSSQSINSVESGYTQLGTDLRASPNMRSVAIVQADIDDTSPTVNLNWGSAWAGVALEIAAGSSDVTVAPAPGSLLLTGFAPQLTGFGQTVAPAAAALVLTGLAPVIGGTSSSREAQAFTDYALRYLYPPTGTCRGHFMIGPVYAPQTKARLTGGIGEEVYLVTNTNTSGAGSLFAALTAAKAAGGGYILIQVSGFVNQLISMDNLENVTIDGRLQNFRVRGLYFGDTSGGSNANGNVVIVNIGFEQGTGDQDYFRNYTRNFAYGPLFMAYTHFEVSNESAIDEALDLHINREKDVTIAWSRFRRTTGTTNVLAMIVWSDGGSPATTPSLFKALLHHTYFEPSTDNRAIDYRTPLFGGRPHASGNDPATAATLWSLNNHIAAEENGFYVSGSSYAHSVGDTLDGQYVGGGDPTILLRDDPSYSPNPSVRVDSPRTINGGSYRERNRTLVTPLLTAYPHIVAACTTSPEHDTIVKRRSGNTLRVAISGTAVGAAAGSLVGKYFDLTFPDGVLPSGTTFNAMRQSWIDGCRSHNGYFTGASLFSSVAQVARQSDTVIRMTIDQEPAYAGGSPASDDYVFFWGPHDDVNDRMHFGTPFPALIEQGGSVTVSPSAGSLILTGTVPTTDTSGNLTVSPARASLVLAGAAPTAKYNVTVSPATASLVLTGAAPTIPGNPTTITLSLPRGTAKLE